MEIVTAELLNQLAQTRTVADACALTLESTSAASGFDRGVLLIGGRVDRHRVHGAAVGIADHRFDALLTALRRDGDSTGVDELFAVERPEVRTLPSGFTRIGLETAAVQPFELPGVDTRGLLLLAAEAGSEIDASTTRVLDAVRACAPAIARCLQVESLSARVEKLDRQRDLLTGIVNAMPDPVVLTDAENKILLANDRAEQVLTPGASDSEGRRRAIQLNNLLLSSFLTQATISTGAAPGRELTLVDPADGSDLVFEVLSSRMPLGIDAARGASISILRDITDLKQAVTELEREYNRSRAAEHRSRQEWERLTVILENVSDPILVTDDQSNIIQMNREAERLFDIPVSFGPDSPRRRSVRANDTRFTGLISDFLLQPAHRRVEEIELVDPDAARPFPVEVVSTKILNKRGEPTAIVSILHDLTQAAENERLARELQQLNDELEERIRHATRELENHNRQLEWQSQELERASRLKSEFLASMSHELRTPINALLGYTAILQEGIYGELTDKQKGALAKVALAAQQLLALINDILDLSKIEAGRMVVQLGDVEVDEVIQEVSETIDPLIREKSLRFDIDVEPELPTLRTDGTKLRQILLNLLSNAVKFTHDGGITLSAVMADEDNVRLTVTDTGIGIKNDDLEQIFEDFRQVDQSSTREYRGTGLGLSITKKLLTLLGGEIAVDSVYGKGSTFSVLVPVRTELEPAGSPAEAVAVGQTEA